MKNNQKMIKTQTENTKGEILLYQTEDNKTKIQVKLEKGTVWLSLNQISALFQRDKSVISRHIKNIFEEGELEKNSVVAFFATTGNDNKIYNVEYFNLEMIISVGYRVKSNRGTQFRIWATDKLKEFIIKGFALDDERLKRASEGNYFEELLSRIRDIRSSEKVFWKKVLEIYATSIDYSPLVEDSKKFFATVQNKMHFAAHRKTAAEVIFERANAQKPNMGLTYYQGSKPRKKDTEIAKNYLNETELDKLNRIVTLYLDFAELQALNRKPMYMKDWIKKLDEFLNTSELDVLKSSGKVSHEEALKKAEEEYEKFYQSAIGKESEVEKHFFETIKKIKKLEKRKKN